MDITSGIDMQTKVQKLMFERWGETLVMDFTHGTNNLGYQLAATCKRCQVYRCGKYTAQTKRSHVTMWIGRAPACSTQAITYRVDI
ncbi:hypothetical protein GQ600_24003 [Phytophthora cactorum]|nr:hypothetical protein GQ600_24003 [Phytophthora cactorum]